MAKLSGSSKIEISELPTLLAYPSVLNIEECTNVGIDGMLCYIVEHYGNTGISCLVKRHVQSDRVSLQFGDWSGTYYDLDNHADPMSEICRSLLNEHGSNFIKLMRYAKIEQALFYITINAGRQFKLVDVRLSFNKFFGPGMLRDVFSNLIETQKVLSIEGITPTFKEAIVLGNGKYSGDLILKPSRFRVIKWNNVVSPLYVEITR